MSSCNVCSRNVQIVNSVSYHTKPFSVAKHDFSHNVNKPVICKSLHVEPLNVSKSMSYCNVRNQNVHIVNCVSHHTKPLSVGKSDCSCNVGKPVICESVVVNLSKCAFKRSFDITSHKHGVTKSLNVRSILMTSIYFYDLILMFFIFHHNFCSDSVDNFFKGYVMHGSFSTNEFLNYGSFVYHDVNIFNISRTNGVFLNFFFFFNFYFYFFFFQDWIATTRSYKNKMHKKITAYRKSV